MAKFVTDIEIIEDLFDKLIAGGLGDTITGDIYLKKRPYGSILEDCVVSFLAGTDGQKQVGLVTCNIFVPNIIVSNNNGYEYEDTKRTKAISLKLNDIIHNGLVMQRGRYFWRPNTMVSVFEHEKADEHSHFVHVELAFQNNTCYDPEIEPARQMQAGAMGVLQKTKNTNINN